MKTYPIIPWGSHNQRSSIPVSDGTLAAKDQRFVNCYPELVKNPVSGKSTVSVKKRPGFISHCAGAGSPFQPSALGVHLSPDGIWSNPVIAYYDGSSSVTSKLYYGSVNIGTISKITENYDFLVKHIDLTSIGNYAINVFSCGIWQGVSLANATTAYFYPFTTAYSINPVVSSTFAGDTHTNTTIDNIADTSAFYVGQPISGTGIPAGTRIATIAGAASITTTLATTATNAGVTITRTHLAKIIDTDFPSNQIGGFAFLDGYAFAMTGLGKIYNSDLNALWSWTSTSFITAGALSDGGVGVIRLRDEIVAFGTSSIEFFYNAGNPTGSPLSVVKGATVNIGCESEYGYCRFGESIAFVGSGAGTAGKGVYLLAGRAPQKISTNREDAILNSYLAALGAPHFNSRWVLSSGYVDGQLTLFCIAEDQTYGLAYLSETQVWFELSASSIYEAVSIGAYTFVSNLSNTNGFLQRLPTNTESSLSFKDATSSSTVGTAITATMIMALGNFESPDRKGMRRLAVDADTESGTSTLNVSWSDDDYATFSTPRTIDLTLTGKKELRNLTGSFINRAMKITHSDNTGFRIRRFYADVG